MQPGHRAVVAAQRAAPAGLGHQDALHLLAPAVDRAAATQAAAEAVLASADDKVVPCTGQVAWTVSAPAARAGAVSASRTPRGVASPYCLSQCRTVA